jgi:glycosyltransferase involved in cell wall biosynthesis
MSILDSTLVVIPALNEESTVGGIVRLALQLGVAEVVVIDDNSTDHTASIARAAGATVVSLSERLGAWPAIQTGFRYAVRRGARIVVTMDADGQHVADDLPRLISTLSTSSANVAIASCPERGSALRKIAWRWIRYITKLPINDITSGFRAYDRLAIRRLAAWPASLLEYQDVGVLLILQKSKLSIVEVEVHMPSRQDGKSRIFGTWGTVVYYMLQTSILGAAKRPRGKLSSDQPARAIR